MTEREEIDKKSDTVDVMIAHFLSMSQMLKNHNTFLIAKGLEGNFHFRYGDEE